MGIYSLRFPKIDTGYEIASLSRMSNKKAEIISQLKILNPYRKCFCRVND